MSQVSQIEVLCATFAKYLELLTAVNSKLDKILECILEGDDVMEDISESDGSVVGDESDSDSEAEASVSGDRLFVPVVGSSSSGSSEAKDSGESATTLGVSALPQKIYRFR